MKDTTYIGEWARNERLRRKWSQSQACAALQQTTGVSCSRVWLSKVENGHEPSDELLDGLEQLYGSAPKQPEPQRSDELNALIDEMRQLNAHLASLLAKR